MHLHFFNSAFIVNSKMDYFVKMYLPVNLNTRGCCRQRGGGGVTFSYLILSGFCTLSVFAIFFNRFGMSIGKRGGYLP